MVGQEEQILAELHQSETRDCQNAAGEFVPV